MRHVRRLLAVWSRATPDDKRQGLAWYREARREARAMAREHDVSLSTAAGVIAALSPRMHWVHNVRSAHRLLACQDVTGVFMASVVKGQRIFAGERPLKVLTGPKVRAFYRAIMGEHDAAVVDVWIARAAGVQDAPTAKEYAKVAAALTRAAAQVGVSVPVFQATTWVTVRGRA